MTNTHSSRLKQAVAALQAGERAQARALILAELRDDPNNLTTWLWALEVAYTEKEKRSILGKILKLDPNHNGALQYLKNLDQSGDISPEILSQHPAESSGPLPSASEKEKGTAGGIIRLFTDWITSLPVSCGFIVIFAVIVASAFIYFRVNTSLYGLIGNDFDE